MQNPFNRSVSLGAVNDAGRAAVCQGDPVLRVSASAFKAC